MRLRQSTGRLLLLAGVRRPVRWRLSSPRCPRPRSFSVSPGRDCAASKQERSDYWEPHVANSHRRILEAASHCEHHSRALVLGAGNCTEIPLEDLARNFDEVVLTDLDDASMAAAVEDLPDDLAAKVHVQVEDVTTFAAPLMRRLWQAVESSETAEQAFERIAGRSAGLRRTTLRDEAARGRPGRLFAGAFRAASLSVELRRAIGCATSLENGSRHGTATSASARSFSRWRCAIICGCWRAVCRRGGAVYFADTIARGPLYDKIDRGAPAASASDDAAESGSPGPVWRASAVTRSCATPLPPRLKSYARVGRAASRRRAKRRWRMIERLAADLHRSRSPTAEPPARRRSICCATSGSMWRPRPKRLSGCWRCTPPRPTVSSLCVPLEALRGRVEPTRACGAGRRRIVVVARIPLFDRI